ncbi:hypothetical protein [Ancylobacter amanitiformis]|uniref:DUF2154 domain-containing protein n=1 Tax=Ancylobacter amanitiformis TaxID=217069 RepID=A0ABU0LNS4_9HYPH|nr:hypothetical protein [Ancylobacter amanitiformis]MDQ0510357.1 hypothetical protein [Ancylobacter amanitiformis]
MKMLVLVLAALLVGVSLARADDRRLDLAGVERVEIIGDAATVKLTARPGGTPQAHLAERRTGWFSRWYSSWFYNDCRTSSRMWVEGVVLRVEARTPSLLESSDCVVELTANLPPDVSVRIDLAAVEAQLDGRFAALDTQTRAGDLVLAGAVDRVDLRGTALRARLDFSEAPPRAVHLAVGSLDAQITLPMQASVGWRVDAKAALVDTVRANDSDGATQIRVSADFLRLSIR